MRNIDHSESTVLRLTAQRSTSSSSALDFIDAVKAIVGHSQVLVGDGATRPYRTGFRTGEGAALAVIRPRSLVEQWRVLQACIAFDKLIIMQAANTGLTGGSTPDCDGYDRDVVIINTMHLARIHVIDEGRQVICLPGASLYQLEEVLAHYRREPHSVIGSSCIGASVVGGICNNSGGALIKRGPAYTQMAVFARLNESGQLELINHLGVQLGGDTEEALRRLEHGQFATTDIEHDPARHCSDHEYATRVREIDSQTPARFNADPRRLFETSGSAGKLAVFAVRLDTFPQDKQTSVFYIGTNDPTELTALRRHILSNFKTLPIAGEYLHRDMFDIAETYGKDSFITIRHLGTKRLPLLFKLKRVFDKLGSGDRWLQRAASLFPAQLPVRMQAFRDRFEHHLILKMDGPGSVEALACLQARFPSATGHFFECTPQEGAKALLHRFVAAGAAIRYRTIHPDEVEDILALDVALKQNDRDWQHALPEDIRQHIHLGLYYGHLFCHVFHWDYLVRKGSDVHALKRRLLEWLDSRGAQYPAEHNVGHLYPASIALAKFYRDLDPCNQFNPGIGQTSKRAAWQASSNSHA